MSRRAFPSLVVKNAAARRGDLFNVVIYPVNNHNIVFTILDGDKSATVSLHVDDLRRMVGVVDKKREEEQIDPNTVGW